VIEAQQAATMNFTALSFCTEPGGMAHASPEAGHLSTKTRKKSCSPRLAFSLCQRIHVCGGITDFIEAGNSRGLTQPVHTRTFFWWGSLEQTYLS
jgi:hypothetical protein